MVFAAVFAVYAVVAGAVVLATEGLPGPQRRGVFLGVFTVMPGIIFLLKAISDGEIGAYVMAALGISAGGAIVYLSWIGVLPLIPRKPDDRDGRS